MMTVEIKINGKLRGKMEFVNAEMRCEGKPLYTVRVVEESRDGKPFQYDTRYVAHIPEQGMMQLISNGLSVLGWDPKTWAGDVPR